MKNRFQLLEDTEDNEFMTNFVNIVSESPENFGLGEEKPIEKISEETCQLKEKKRKMKYNKENIAKIEFSELCKTQKQKIVQEARRFNCNMIQKAIEENKA